MQKFRQLDEALDWIVQGPTSQEKIKRFKFVVDTNSIFLRLVKWGIGHEPGIVGLPEGIPDTMKFENIPANLSDTTITQEFRRICTFLENGSVHRLSRVKKEQNWLQILSGIHPKEAMLLTYIKDHTLLEHYPNIEEVLPHFIPDVKLPKDRKLFKLST